jgi:hypothetical protein
MSVNYSLPVINARLQAVANTIDAAGSPGYLIIRNNSGTTLSTIQLARPCGTVNGGILTFTGTLLDPAATATGTAENAIITDASGAVMISGLTVGIPLSSADIIMSNGLNSTVISVGQVVQLLSAQITGT